MACNMNPDSPMSDRILGNQLLAPQLGNPSASRTPLLERCARDVLEWQPAVITGSPSFIYAFARYAESVSLKLPSLRAVFYHVEPASRIHTRCIESAFGVSGRSLYILSELGWLAVERVPGRMIPSTGVILEVLRDGKPVAPGEIGHVAVTRTQHGSPALIRYDTRDLARLNDDGVTISRLLGRPHTALVARADGSKVPMDSVDAAIAEAGAGAIAFYRLYRRGSASAPRFVLDCAPSGAGEVDGALRAIGDALGEILASSVDVRKTSGIPPHRGGRMPLFLDEVEA
jgi:phenylacetate-coenzyme A ligase PaaK-like adenylate-forming protein